MRSSPFIRAFFFLLLTLAIGITCAKEIDTKDINEYNFTTSNARDSSLNNGQKIKPLEEQDNQKEFLLALQLGGALTLLTWATIRSLHTREKKYVFFAVTLFLAIVRLLLNNQNNLTDLTLSAEEIYQLSPFLNLGTMMNGLYTVHLAASSQDIQAKRKYFIYTLFAAAIIAATLSLFIPRPLFIGVALTILVPFVTLVIHDLIHSAKNNQEGKQVLVLILLMLAVLVSTLSINLLSYIQASTAGAEDFKPFNPGLHVFVLSGILFIYGIPSNL